MSAGVLPAATAAKTTSKRERTTRPLALIAGLSILALLLGVGVVALFWTPYPPMSTGVGGVYAPPSLAHPFGTDRLGADVLSRTMAAATVDVSITVAVVLLSLTIGTLWGSLAGFYGGWFDYLTMRALELLNSFPSLLLAMLVIAVAGPGILNVILVVALLPLPDYVRLARAELRSKKTWQFAEAAQLVGRRPSGVLFSHLVPNSLRPLLTFASVNASYVAATVGALGFLGLGIQPGAAEWGSMIARGQDAILSGQWWVAGFPGLAIFLLAAAFHLLSDAIADSRDQGGAW
ncbi:ABC transporter permease [Rathayibacter sp. VKM Ac-2760]|uniref:ABC transporter permease n=1 Tax=Rathayibacter sp. VKM Ac-2760 TaxID=2609253 RepID=UPI0013191B51|nr:ABC transporter permease [Rathayibacter sp. VKM Ac-2760]QHC60399.1 ABC transporter permease subunit [Rathayibacter sp. VKM Ac-2760]